MTPLDRLRAHPLPFADLLGVEFIGASADSVSARIINSP